MLIKVINAIVLFLSCLAIKFALPDIVQPVSGLEPPRIDNHNEPSQLSDAVRSSAQPPRSNILDNRQPRERRPVFKDTVAESRDIRSVSSNTDRTSELTNDETKSRALIGGSREAVKEPVSTMQGVDSEFTPSWQAPNQNEGDVEGVMPKGPPKRYSTQRAGKGIEMVAGEYGDIAQEASFVGEDGIEEAITEDAGSAMKGTYPTLQQQQQLYLNNMTSVPSLSQRVQPTTSLAYYGMCQCLITGILH